jgi:hypothetical protein
MYLLKYRSIVNKSDYRKCTCPYNCPHSHILSENEFIPLYKNYVHKIKKYKYYNNIQNITNHHKISSFSPKVINSNRNKIFYSNSKENSNKSAFCNYINLNKTNYYYNGNNNNKSKYSSHAIYNDHNHNTTTYYSYNAKNNIRDKKYFVKIKLSNNHSKAANLCKNDFIVKNKNSCIGEYSNNIVNLNKKFFDEKRGKRRHNSYKNLTLPHKLNSNNNSGIKNNYSSYSSYSIINYPYPYKKNQKQIITERIYNRVYKNASLPKKKIIKI